MDWHARFLQQAGWTRPLRSYLFGQAGLEQAGRVLEVGCGTGAILADLPPGPAVHGLDLEPGRLFEARRHAPRAALTCADALALPYPAGSFDLACCHFLLLWVRDPLQALVEMKRVTRLGGSVLALAEPDYENRVDEPASLAILGRWQTEALRRQGADPGLGSRLAGLFEQAGIRPIETGPLRGSGEERLPPSGQALEWAVLQSDLAGRMPGRELRRLRVLDEAAWQSGQRRLSVPTYFAWGRV
jgi:SAM-dependent methyltransferase